MQNIVFLVLRRMRLPLIVLICTYAFAVLGFVLIPGMDDQGNPWRMGFFHAFYFVSYMGSTIGFGEIPYPFTDAQRLWTTLTIYASVISWFYAIGSLLSLIQQPAFRQAFTRNAFTRSVRRISEPFYLVCGYGDTGSLLVKALAEQGLRSTVVDIDQDRINALELADLGLYVPGLCANAADTSSLLDAGLKSGRCIGVVALTNKDHINLKVAITSKLLHPKIKVICRAESQDECANMASFGTDHIINPFDTFAEHLAMAIDAPGLRLLHDWFTSVPQSPLCDPVFPPRGNWLLCGYGRFGKSMHRALSEAGIHTTVIEARPDLTNPPPGTVIGRGTEADTLHDGGIKDAVGIVAGTDDDANNLSIVMTASEVKPDIFTVARQNERENATIYQAAHLNLVMQRSEIITRRILTLITTPLIIDFLELSQKQQDSWANRLASTISGLVNDQVPQTWSISVDARHTPALVETLNSGQKIKVGYLLRNPDDHRENLACILLMAKRNRRKFLLPEADFELQEDDQLLFCGNDSAPGCINWTTGNLNILRYVISGETYPLGYVWQRLTEKRRQTQSV